MIWSYRRFSRQPQRSHVLAFVGFFNPDIHVCISSILSISAAPFPPNMEQQDQDSHMTVVCVGFEATQGSHRHQGFRIPISKMGHVLEKTRRAPLLCPLCILDSADINESTILCFEREDNQHSSLVSNISGDGTTMRKHGEKVRREKTTMYSPRTSFGRTERP